MNLNYLLASFVYILIQKSSLHFYSVGMGLLFEVVVTHSKQVISVKGSYYSTINDKNSVKYSNFIQSLFGNGRSICSVHIKELSPGMGPAGGFGCVACINASLKVYRRDGWFWRRNAGLELYQS